MKDLYFLLFIPVLFSCKSKKQDNAIIPVEYNHAIPAGYENLKLATNMKDILCQNWENKEDQQEAEEYGVPGDFEWVFRGYRFYKDGTFVKYPRGFIEVGKWQLNETAKPVTISIDLGNNEKELYKLAMLTPTVLKIQNEFSGLQEYTGTGLSAEKSIDPIHPSNNQWRFAPSEPESAAQIKERVKGCIHFFVLFYDDMINTNAQLISFNGFPSCFTWYSGGIYMQNKDKLQKKWIHCFYNMKDALKGYAFAEKLLSQKYTWPKGEKSWLKLNVAVLKQMEKKADSIDLQFSEPQL